MGWGQSFPKAGARRKEGDQDGVSGGGWFSELDQFLSCLGGRFISLSTGSEFIV